MKMHLSQRRFAKVGALSAAIALGLCQTAWAQTSTTKDADDERGNEQVTALGTVSVSASRIDAIGFSAPTPTTVITAEDFAVGARANIGAALNDLPAFRATTSPSTTATNISVGATRVDLRGLGNGRTLVLLDGKRFVGGDDMNSVPMSLVRAVDVVTGGASAAWGSDAVSGVVNIQIDDTFDGVRLEGRAGVSPERGGNEGLLSIAAGTSFADGRGHVVFGAEYFDNAGIGPKTERKNVANWEMIVNPVAGGAQYLLAPDVVFANASTGGLILSGSLAGQTFNPDGTLRPFQYGGSLSGVGLAGLGDAQMYGGEGVSWANYSQLTTPLTREAALARVRFDLTDSVRLKADLRYTDTYNHYGWFPETMGNIAISADNAFLDPSIRDALLAAGETGFRLSRVNQDILISEVEYSKRNLQGTVSLEGYFGDGWRWDAYASHGEHKGEFKFHNFRVTEHWNNAINAVTDPVTGAPVCAVTLTDPGVACVPINLFGEGAASPEALAYIAAASTQDQTTTLTLGGFSLRGEPFEGWAGPISIATGAEWRREKTETVVDARSQNFQFAFFNPAPLKGDYDVAEAFFETVVPLVRDVPLLQRLDFNGAARYSDYSTSGGIWSWKLGLSNEFNDDLRLRATLSRDIRSANLTELYNNMTTGYTTIGDPVTGQSYMVLINGGGNPTLVPETGDTTSFGFVYTPQAVPGLSVSVDYFDIEISDVIGSIAAQEAINRCAAGNQSLCGHITRDPATNQITRVWIPEVNLARFQTSGVDFESLYAFPLSNIVASLPGNLRLRSMITYVDELVRDDGIRAIDHVTTTNSAGVPRWRGNVSIGYGHQNFSTELRARYIAPGYYNRTLDIENNAIGSYTYYDFSARYTLPGTGVSLFGGVTNLTDKDPPIASTAPAYYDIIGRYYNVGLTLRF